MNERTLPAARRRLLLSAGSLLAAAAGLSLARGARADEAPAATTAAMPPQPAAPLRTLEDLGVDIVTLRLGANDFLIDLRYRVKDVGRAQPLLEQKIKPVLVNETTGDRFYIPQPPKVGALRQSATAKQPAIAGRVYFMLFANPDRRLKAGERVTLYAGDTVVKDLVVG